MYAPEPFNQTDTAAIYKLMEDYPFATLVSTDQPLPLATHIPFRLFRKEDGTAVLRAHLAKANPHAALLTDGAKVLVVFMGPHAYISSSWYSHINVPTWNYAAVHAHGTVRLLNETETLQSLAELTNHYEASQEKPFDMAQMPAAMLREYLSELLAFEISIDQTHAAWKLSQNRNETDFKNIIAGLEKLQDGNAKATAEKMRNL